MNEKFILSIDCGTQSLRALIFNSKGELIINKKIEFDPYFSINPGWAEQDPELYWKSLCIATKSIKESNPEYINNINGIVVTTMRDTPVTFDKNFNVNRASILWLDQRMADVKEKIPFFDWIQFSISGMLRPVLITRRKSRAHWIRLNEPDIWENTKKFGLLSTFFNFKLTGEFKDSKASQIGHIPFDYRNRDWEKSNNHWRWYVFGVERDKLPELVEPAEIIGYVTKKASEETGLIEGIPVFAGGSDKGCETIGNGCDSEDKASISFGTASTIQVTTSKYYEPIMFYPSYPAVIPKHYNPEIQIYRGYWMINWFKKEFAAHEEIEAKKLNISAEELLNRRLSEIRPGSDGLILQPYWTPPLKTPDAKGAIIGFGDVHTRIHVYRAIIEGINYALMEGLEKIEKKSHVKVNKIFVSGGGSQSDAICQITSDMFNLPVYKNSIHEASGLGAAIIGFVGLGVYKTFNEAISNMVHYSKIFYPNKSNSIIYKKLFNKVYKKIFKKLHPLYKNIRSITNYPEF